MIILNGKGFAESEDEFIDSLFNPINGSTCAGYAKRLKRQVKLFDHQHSLIGVINKYGVLARATKLKSGYWYSFADIDQVGSYESYAQSKEDVQALVVDKQYQGIEPIYQYK